MSLISGLLQISTILAVFQQDIDVPFSEFFRNLQVAMPCNLVSGQLGPGSVWYVAFDGRTNFSGSVVREWVKFVNLNLHNAHNVVPLNGDLIRSTVLVNDFAVLVLVNAD
jgi:hypothetical protein